MHSNTHNSAWVCICSSRGPINEICIEKKYEITTKSVSDMIFDMCQQTMEASSSGRWDARRVCFLGLCCLYTAALSLVESQSGNIHEQGVSKLKKGLELYSSRWHIGGRALTFHNTISDSSNIIFCRSSIKAPSAASLNCLVLIDRPLFYDIYCTI